MPFKPLKPTEQSDGDIGKSNGSNLSNGSKVNGSKSSVEQVEHYSNYGTGKLKLAIHQHSFWLFLIFSATLHALLWVLTPNPLKQTEKQKSPEDIEVVGTVPTVNLPQKKIPNPSKLSQIAKQDLPSPQNNENPENVKSAIVDLPKNASKKSESEEDKKSVKPDNKPAESKKSADKVTPKTEPKSESQNEPSSDQLDDLANKKTTQPDNTLDQKTESQNKNDKQADPTAERNAEPATAGATLSQDQFRSQFGKIYAEYAIKYGKENVVQRIIPSPQETTVSQVSQSIEPGINWIPPVEQPKSLDLKGKNTKVTVTLIVAPDGKIEKKWMFSSKNSNVDEIVKKTVKGYESKFAPLEGKIRIVTISYDFPG
ncbi:TonB C-terminal domain-containing protein [Pseudanabaena sp. PCC 6802]|uniref:TonB C-terminal domain-containing protein n=1 Tax=Pseudanabaena sp. PCC 6802 TaxID=118173 RepID=UPI0003455A53|nr:TonB C-terminal domain-containing protein [Pseudanabaena sp. PCC 6802]